MRSKRNLVCVAAAALLGVTACGGGGGGTNVVGPDNTWTLTVGVTTEQRQPIRNATVRILDGPDASKTANTDDSGTAVMYGIRPGSFSIEVTAPEYYRSTTAVTLNTSTTVTVPLKERNKAPVLSSLVAHGGDPGQPPNMCDLGDEVTVTATVADQETPVDQLTFAWTADVGTLNGTGNVVRWVAPSSGATPLQATIGVTITEKFTAPGSSTPEENVTKGEVKVSVHESYGEVASVARGFLLDFSNSSIPAATVISRYFSTSPRCADGRASELSDVTRDRTNYLILSYTVGTPSVQIHWDSISPFRARPGDAWIDVSCGWTSKGINPLIPEEYEKTLTSSGTCRLTAVFANNEWGLCWSDYDTTAAASAEGQPKYSIR